MSFDDKKFGPLFPTRTGGSTGTANERQMLDGIGGADGFRKRFQTNADGSVTQCNTRNGCPEFITANSSTDKVYANWAWPWHGIWRGVDNVIETSAGDISSPGDNPEPGNMNFLPHAKTAFTTVPAPKTSPAGATWVNWAAVGGGVLMGETVGMNVWLYTTSDKAWVVSMSFPTSSTVQLQFYTLDNWVKGCSPTLAAAYVQYDKKPTPYMVKNKPDGSARIVEQTLVVPLPAYYRDGSSYITKKRSDVSRTGAKIIIAYEARGGVGTPIIVEPSINMAEGFQLEDQWVELTIAWSKDLGFSASALTIATGAASLLARTDTTTRVQNTVFINPELTYGSCTRVTTVNAAGSGILGVIYDDTDTASEVRWSGTKSELYNTFFQKTPAATNGDTTIHYSLKISLTNSVAIKEHEFTKTITATHLKTFESQSTEYPYLTYYNFCSNASVLTEGLGNSTNDTLENSTVIQHEVSIISPTVISVIGTQTGTSDVTTVAIDDTRFGVCQFGAPVGIPGDPVAIGMPRFFTNTSLFLPASVLGEPSWHFAIRRTALNTFAFDVVTYPSGIRSSRLAGYLDPTGWSIVAGGASSQSGVTTSYSEVKNEHALTISPPSGATKTRTYV